MESKIPTNGSTDQIGSRAPISLAGKFVADVLAKPAAGTRSDEINIMGKKQTNRFRRLFSIFHMCYYFNFQELLKQAN
jgi:hypothetical protein